MTLPTGVNDDIDRRVCLLASGKKSTRLMDMSAFPPYVSCDLSGSIIDGSSQGIVLSSPRRPR
jgi:hypothetical protein